MEGSAFCDDRQRLPAELRFLHLPPQRRGRRTHHDRLVLAAASYATRSLSHRVVVARCAYWFEMSERDVEGSLRRLQEDGAVALRDNRVHLISAYRDKARRLHQRFTITENQVARFRAGELSALHLGLLGLLPNRGDGWADTDGCLAEMLGVNRADLSRARKHLATAGYISSQGEYRLLNGHYAKVWRPCASGGATPTLGNATTTLPNATPTQSGTLRDLRPSVSSKLPAKPAETEATDVGDRQQIVESWITETLELRIEVLDPENASHVRQVRRLIDWLDPNPAPWIAARRGETSLRLTRWGSHSETLASFAMLVIHHTKPSSLVAYLNTCAQGMEIRRLFSQMKNELGRGAESYQHFSRAAERAIEGPFATEVQQLVAGTAETMAVVDPAQRGLMRGQLKQLLASGRHRGAARLLRATFGTDPTDGELEVVCAGICSVHLARALLGAA